MDIIEIEQGSEAWREIALAVETGHTLRLHVRTGGVAVKINQGTWSPTLSTKA